MLSVKFVKLEIFADCVLFVKNENISLHKNVLLQYTCILCMVRRKKREEEAEVEEEEE